MMKRFGTAVLLQGGDPEISAALADGIARGRVLRPAEMLTVQDEIIRQRTKRRLEAMELRQGRDARYWSNLCFEAEMAYGESLFNETALERFGKKILTAYAFVFYALRGEIFGNTRRRKRR